MFNIRKKSNRKTLYIFDKIPLISFKIDGNDKIISKKKIYDLFLNIACWFVPTKKARRKIRLLNGFVVKDFNYRRTAKPVEPYAYIRVYNEIKTIDACLSSILPVIKKGVIGYNDCNDGSEEYILEFCKKNKGFIPYKYPYHILSPNDPKLFEKNCDEKHKLYYYCNEVLKQLPKNEWIIKIDCDHVFDKEKLENLMYLPTNNNDVVILPRLNLHYDNEKLYFIKNCPIITSKDFWLIYNNNLEFKPMPCNKNTMLIEHLDVSSRNVIHSEASNYHFPMIKKRRNSFSQDNLVEFNKFISEGLLDKYIKDKGLPVIIDERLIKNIASNENIKKIKVD